MATVGPLERRVLDLLAGHEEATVRGILSELGDAYAYTTVMTTLDRLFKKAFSTAVKRIGLMFIGFDILTRTSR